MPVSYWACNRYLRTGLRFTLTVIITVSCLSSPVWGKERSRIYPALFGSTEKMFPDTGLFPKWSDMLKRLIRFNALSVVPCRRVLHLNFCEIQAWTTFTETLRGGKKMAVLDAVNHFINKYPYVLDIANYGVDDYWATPQEHVTNGGDCEDYAIAKYITLRRLGFLPSDMRVVILNDLDLKVQHAVLAVYIGGKAYILDNQTARVQPSTLIYHYQPIYSITEGAWWMHFTAPHTSLSAARH